MARRKKLRYLAITAVALVLGWAAVWMAISHNLRKETFETRLSESLGVDLKIDSVALDWQGRIELNQITLTTRAGHALGSVAQAQANVEMGPLLGGQLRIRALQLDRLQLQLSNAVATDLGQISRPQTGAGRIYPIRLINSQLEWLPSNTAGTPFVIGPLEALLPAQTQPDQVQFQAVLGKKTALNVTVEPALTEFILDTRAGDGLPAQWIHSLGADDRLKAAGRWANGELSVDAQLATHGIEVPLKLRWKQQQPEQVEIEGGEGSTKLVLNLSNPDQVEMELQPGSRWGASWKGRGRFTRGGAIQADLQLGFQDFVQADLRLVRKGEAAISLDGRADLALSKWKLPNLRVEAKAEGNAQEIQGNYQVLRAGKALASGKIDWTPASGFSCDFVAALLPELLQDFPLRGDLAGQFQAPPGKPWALSLSSHQLFLAHRSLVDLNAQYYPLEQRGEGSFQVGPSPSKENPLVKLYLHNGKFSLEGIGIPLEGFGTAQNLLDLKLLVSNQELEITQARLVHKGRALPALTTRWKFQDGLWDCQTLQIGNFKGILDGAPRLRFNPATLQIQGDCVEGTLAPRLSLKSHLNRVDLSRLKGALPDSPDIRGFLSGDARLSGDSANLLFAFEGAGADINFPQSHIGSAKISLEAQTVANSLSRIRLNVSEIPANQIGVLGERYPGLEGQISLSLEGPPANLEGSLSLAQARLRGAEFPALNAAFSVNSQVFLLDSLDVASSPPLKLVGQFGFADKSLKFSTQLQGQSLLELAKIAGAAPRREIQGRLFGLLRIEGSSQNPVVNFKGSLAELIIEGVKVGQASLEVLVSDVLQGELKLAQPADGADFGKTAGIRGMVKVAGVRFGGTPKQPKIEPMLVGPKLDFSHF